MILAYSDAYRCEPNHVGLRESSHSFSPLSPCHSSVPSCIHPDLSLPLGQVGFGLSCGWIHPLTKKADNSIT